MRLLSRVLGVVFAMLFLTPLYASADTYQIATFSGQLGSSPNIKAPFSGNGFSGGMAFSGSFVIDDNLIPSSGSGFVNIFFANFPDAGIIPNATAFTLNIGGLTFNLGDALSPFPGFRDAGIQYNNGVFNGFFFVADFMFQGSPFELDLQGNTLSIHPFDSFGNPIVTTNVVRGSINVGDSALMNITSFTPGNTPTVPEPGTFGLAGIAALALLVSGRKRLFRASRNLA